MKQRRILILMGLVLFAIALTALLSACGAGTKVYTDLTYGYSISYPGDWRLNNGTSDVTAGGQVSGNVAIYNPEGSKAGDTYVDLALIVVYNLSTKVTDPWAASTQSELESVLTDLQSRTSDVKVVEPLKQTTAGGLKGYSVSYTFTKNGAALHSTLYFLFDGTREYELNEQAAVASWDKTKLQLDKMVDGFKPGKFKEEKATTTT